MISDTELTKKHKGSVLTYVSETLAGAGKLDQTISEGLSTD